MRCLNKKYWPHKVRVNKGDEPYKWLQENMPGKDRWRLAGPNNWYFAEGKDAVMFSLRWAS